MSMARGQELSHGRRLPLAVLERDAALTRVSRTRRWLILAAAALTAGFAALVSAVAPGRTLRSKHAVALRTSPVRPAAPRRLTMPPLAKPGQLGLQGPAQAPQALPDPSASAPAAPAPSDPSQPS